MAERWFDLALWLTPHSAWPEIVERRAVDVWTLPHEAVEALLQEHGECYAFKVAVNLGSWPSRCYWHVRLAGAGNQAKPSVSVGDVVKQLWQLFEEDGINPLDVSSRDALGLVRAVAECEPGGLCANWYQALPVAKARELRAFVDGWNGRRSAEVRYWLLLEMDEEQPETRRQ